MKNIKTLMPTRYVNIISAIVFAIVAYWLLAIDGEFFLQKIEALSIFLPTLDFMKEQMAVPGGLLAALSLFLTQTFFHPWLGASVYILLLLSIASLAVKAFRLPWRFFPATLILPVMVLLALLNMEYLIFSMKTPGYAFLFPLGIIACLALGWDYGRMGKKWGERLTTTIVVAVMGFYALGIYGLLATGMFMALEIARLLKAKGEARWKPLLNIVIGAIGIIAVPKIWFTQIGGHTIMENLYTYQLPRFYEGEESHFFPYYILYALLLLLSVTRFSESVGTKFLGKEKWQTIFSVFVCLLSIGCIFKFRYTDENFRLTLAIDNALQNCEWHKAAGYAQNMKDEPTRLNVFLTDVALIRTGDAAESMLKYKVSSAEPNTERALRATHDAGSMQLAFQTGLINYAYRWAMENRVEYGLSVEYLKYMTKCALINGEYKLAEKYLDNLSLTAFHKEWAERYRNMLHNPKMMSSDPELSQILPIATKENRFITDNGLLEGYIWKALATMTPQNTKQLELSMVAALICCSIQNFANKMPQYMKTHKGRIPTHFQEAMLMWLFAQGVTDYKKFQIDDDVINRSTQFLDMTKQYSSQSDETIKELARPLFGDTYWYYYEYNKGLKII